MMHMAQNTVDFFYRESRDSIQSRMDSLTDSFKDQWLFDLILTIYMKEKSYQLFKYSKLKDFPSPVRQRALQYNKYA